MSLSPRRCSEAVLLRTAVCAQLRLDEGVAPRVLSLDDAVFSTQIYQYTASVLSLKRDTNFAVTDCETDNYTRSIQRLLCMYGQRRSRTVVLHVEKGVPAVMPQHATSTTYFVVQQ